MRDRSESCCIAQVEYAMNAITTKDGTPSCFIERGAATIMIGAFVCCTCALHVFRASLTNLVTLFCKMDEYAAVANKNPLPQERATARTRSDAA